ncbi:putative DNA-binding domain-containing protein [Sagittula sp. S175]|uniref:HvfC/BufC family peptide modification chaperone n=1 Tax=Sagittula sp. S175 TaxID=3415129 RepID=UPI003C7B9807
MTSLIPQEQFRAGLLDPSQPAPPGLRDALGRPAGRRYDVYRNNVTASVREALETGFPATASLLGERNFASVATRYLRLTPPASPILMLYGETFPAFLETLPDLSHMGYLPDLARLELALRQSYHAADVPPFAPDRIASLTEAQLAHARLTLAPATRLVRSPWPILQIHRRALDPGSPAPKPVAEDILITRPTLDPLPRVLPKGGADFLQALRRSLPLAEAAATAGPDFDPTATLTLLLRDAAIATLHIDGDAI